MCSNVLPSAPQEESSLYPQLTPHNFRMQKANEVSAALNAEVVHYRSVLKKYKWAKKVANWSAAGSSIISTTISSASLASALSVVGLPAAIPLTGSPSSLVTVNMTLRNGVFIRVCMGNTSILRNSSK